ncbi:MAG: class I SAM-dependent methyltransferase [Burkholderiales bacterium]
MMWPLPALCAWALAWALFAGMKYIGVSTGLAVLAACCLGLLGALFAAQKGLSRWRQGLIALGFPVSAFVSGVAVGWPAWAWLLPLLLLLALYPLRSWRDAPLFPTPHDALAGLAAATALPPCVRLMDAGCGLGDGLLALRREYPAAHITGLEWSYLLRMLCALRCGFRGAKVHVARADIWAADWSSYDLVYVFQRPESMTRAMKKARAELRPGSWLVSLEFEVVGQEATKRLVSHPGKPVWLYQMPR